MTRQRNGAQLQYCRLPAHLHTGTPTHYPHTACTLLLHGVHADVVGLPIVHALHLVISTDKPVDLEGLAATQFQNDMMDCDALQMC